MACHLDTLVISTQGETLVTDAWQDSSYRRNDKSLAGMAKTTYLALP